MLEQHLEKLRSFYVAAQEKSLLKASQSLGVTQPAVTKSIRILEGHLKTQLLIRHNRGIELTPAGQLLYQFCDGLFLKARSIERELKHSGDLSGIIRIGTYETLGELFWPKALKMLREMYPLLTVELTTQDPASIWTKLAYGGLDLIVDAEPHTSDQFYSRVLYTDEFGIFCKKGSHLLKKKSASIPISYAVKAIDRHGKSIDEHLRKSSLPYELIYSVESFTLTRSFILEDLCVGVLPTKMAERYLASGIMQSFTSGPKTQYFGEHRVCATVLDAAKDHPKFSKVISALKSCV